MTKGDKHIGRFIYLRCESEFYDAVNDLRQTNNNGYIKFERCTVANATKGGGTWVEDLRLASLLNERTITKDSTGFTNSNNINIAYNSTTRKVTLTGTFEAYYLGEKVTALVSGWESEAHADVHGLYFLRYCETGFEFTTTPWTFDCLQIAFVSYNTYKFGLRECHAFMPWQTHKELHEVIGTYRTAGGGLTGITLNSTTTADRRPDVAATTIEDEDLQSVVAALNTKQYTQRYLSGATPTRLFNVGQSDIIALNGNIPYYNQNVGGTWQQTPIPNNNYAKLFYVAVPVTTDSESQSFRYMWVQPQIIGTLAEIQSVTTTSYSYGDSALFVSEFVFVGEVIINVSGNNWTIYSTALLSGTKLGQIASPTGNFLTTVNHDASLTGSGTSGDPLAVVGSTIDMTTAEFSGAIDETNDKFTIYDFSLLKWIRFSFTNLKSYFKAYFDTIYQAALGYSPENVANKENTTIDTSTTKYPTVNLLKTGLDAKQALNLKFTDTSASSWVADTTYTNYGYKCELTLSGVASTDVAEVTFGHAQAISGNYSPVCLTATNKVTIYSKVNTTITIPTILVNKQS